MLSNIENIYDASNSEITLAFVPLDKLRPHEHIIECNFLNLSNKILRESLFTHPIVVCRESFVILDGHHRFNVMKNVMKAYCIPAYLIDYNDNEICQIGSWNKGNVITKNDVIEACLTERLMKPKQSRHKFCFEQHLLNIPIEILSIRWRGGGNCGDAV